MGLASSNDLEQPMWCWTHSLSSCVTGNSKAVHSTCTVEAKAFHSDYIQLQCVKVESGKSLNQYCIYCIYIYVREMNDT